MGSEFQTRFSGGISRAGRTTEPTGRHKEALVASLGGGEGVDVNPSDVPHVDVRAGGGNGILVLLAASEVRVERSDRSVERGGGRDLVNDGTEDEAVGQAVSRAQSRSGERKTYGGLTVARSKGAFPSLVCSSRNFQAAFSARVFEAR